MTSQRVHDNPSTEAALPGQQWQTRLAAADPTLRVHLVGIGGAGLSAIATVLVELGIQVSGSDRQPNLHTQRLAQAGVRIYTHQQAENLLDLPVAQRPDVVLLSSAVDAANPERRAAEELGLPVVKRIEFLPPLLKQRAVIAVAGTHGKSSTTAMIVKILHDAGLEPGYIVGADLPGHGNAAAGLSPYFVIEADEYDHMFLGLNPQVAVVTNVEWDHPDFYPTPASFHKAFMRFVDQVQRDGMIISCSDDLGAEKLRTYALTRGPRWITYGLASHADLRAEQVRSLGQAGSAAALIWWHAPAGRLELSVPGLHNVRNALAALAVSKCCDVPAETALASLKAYGGVGRRFERKGEAQGVVVIDDYAHHPTEIATTLAAARQRYGDRRIWAVFQPHTFSRTAHMLYRMGESFEDANEVIVTDIFAARETDDGRVSARELAAASPHRSIRHIAKLEDAADYLTEHVRAGDVVITLGAGDGYRVGEMLLASLT